MTTILNLTTNQPSDVKDYANLVPGNPQLTTTPAQPAKKKLIANWVLVDGKLTCQWVAV